MADVITSQPKSVAVAAAPEWASSNPEVRGRGDRGVLPHLRCRSAVLSGSVFTPLAAGAMLMVMIYAGGHISGGHYNPAVTMAALVRGRIGIRDAVGYWIAQAAGGVIAGAPPGRSLTRRRSRP